MWWSSRRRRLRNHHSCKCLRPQDGQSLTPSTSKYMGLDTAPNATELIGAVSGVTFAGGLLGALLQSQQSDRLGRQKSVALSCVLAVIGGALQAGSVNIGMFIAARLVAGLGIGESPSATRMPPSDSHRRTVRFHTPLPERDLSTQVSWSDCWSSWHLHLLGYHLVQVCVTPSAKPFRY